ncbi:hypothetical protein ACHAWF_018654, partial [Thalassiosira exigua]
FALLEIHPLVHSVRVLLSAPPSPPAQTDPKPTAGASRHRLATMPTMISSALLVAALLASAAAAADPEAVVGTEGLHARPSYIGPRDRFNRHYALTKSIPYNGRDVYEPLEECLYVDDGSTPPPHVPRALSPEDRAALEALVADPSAPNAPHKSVGRRIVDKKEERFGPVILVSVLNAIEPLQARALQRLAHCVRLAVPEHFEKRAMYKEFNLDEDPGIGGNSPTHMMPFLGIFLPSLVDTVMQTARFAYDAAGWKGVTTRDVILGTLTDDPSLIPPFHLGELRVKAMPEPEHLGFRASEHLSYDDFPLLAEHHDGTDTAYTINFALSGPSDYDGGELYVDDNDHLRTYFKPEKHSCTVFLGGHYLHGVTEIRGKGGRREMFSNEMWFNPDIPLGANLWNAYGGNIEEYIRACNDLGHVAGGPPCRAEMSDKTQHGISREEVLAGDGEAEDEGEDEGVEWGERGEDGAPRGMVGARGTPPRAIRKDGGWWGQGFSPQYEDEPWPMRAPVGDDYLSEGEEPNFLVPASLSPGELAPLYWRDDRTAVDDDEAFAIGLPPELLEEFAKYVERNGMLRFARKMCYPELNAGDDKIEEFEQGVAHKIYELEDGKTWGVMRPHWEGMDMMWIYPGNEECFESMLHVLRKGNFDVVMEAVADYFELDGLMIQGIGPIFVSYKDHDPDYSQIHHDLEEAKGSFYNVVVPLYIPEDGATLYVADPRRHEPLRMKYNVGTLLGAATRHGTAECNYRDKQDVRLSVAIYMADVDEDNVEVVASDSTSLWPSQGDVEWFWSQRGRLWRRDGSRSLKEDVGRAPLNVEDYIEGCEENEEMCTSDPEGFRLECPKTCKVNMEDGEYYRTLGAMVDELKKPAPAQPPVCENGGEGPGCAEAAAK